MNVAMQQLSKYPHCGGGVKKSSRTTSDGDLVTPPMSYFASQPRD